jgi:hypothetical protein
MDRVLRESAVRLEPRSGNPSRGVGEVHGLTALARPPVADLLAVDREYRRKAAAGLLRTIAPRRFNPEHESWLPILHTSRGERDFTALFSNTARAHRLGRAHDWVVIYYNEPAGGQVTVVTEYAGPLRGRRVVRGREGECLRHCGVEVPVDPSAHTDGDGVI